MSDSLDAKGNSRYFLKYFLQFFWVLLKKKKIILFFRAKIYDGQAYQSVERYAAEYNMSHKKRGIALIFNHEHFDIYSLKTRAGTNVDAENLFKTLIGLNFDVRIRKDLRFSEIQDEIRDISQMDHSDSDCLLVAILSHGELGSIHAKDVQYKLDMIWGAFTPDRCPTLAGKPKLFFIQACQGDMLDSGIELIENRTETDTSTAQNYRIPMLADFLIAYSTVPGYYSWRNTSNGSWFMQSLCEELQLNSHKYDILTLLTFVCQKVALDYESNTPECTAMHQQKQIPCITTMLTRLLKF